MGRPIELVRVEELEEQKRKAAALQPKATKALHNKANKQGDDENCQW